MPAIAEKGIALRYTGSSTTKVAAVVAAAAILFAGAPPAAAQAAETCSGWSHAVNGEGAANMEVTANLKVGPYASCGNVASVAKGTRIFFHCLVENQYGNFWWWVRVSGTSTYGWMSQDNMILSYDGGDDNGDGLVTRASCEE